MKRKLSEVFDTLRAEEIDALLKKNADFSIATETLNRIKSKTFTKVNIAPKTKWRPVNYRRVRYAAFVTCLIIAFCAFIIFPMLKNGGLRYDLPDIPDWSDAKYSAQAIGQIFGKYITDSATTNNYTEIYVPDGKYLYIGDVPDGEYLSLYQLNNISKDLNPDELKSCIDAFFPKLAVSVNAKVPQYEIVKVLSYSNDPMLTVEAYMGTYRLSVTQDDTKTLLQMMPFDTTDRTISLAGEIVQIDQRLSDEEIIDSLQSIKEKLFDIFNVSFTDVKIEREYDGYSKHGAKFIDVYFMNESAHPLNSSRLQPLSDYLHLRFDDRSRDETKEGVLFAKSIDYRINRFDVNQKYTFLEEAKRISIEDAETLLYNGYVFSTHACPICMAKQDKISFKGYEFVELVYYSGNIGETDNQNLFVPFYAFYKKIGTAQNGNSIYARTLVAAIELSGYHEYIESQAFYHKD